MSKAIHFAIIGCGSIAQRHAIEANKTGTIIAVCDTIISRAKTMAGTYHCNYYNSLQSLLQQEQNIDVAVICTPNWLHAAQSIQCLQAGMHVLCEKPMAICVRDAQQMIDAATETAKKLFVVKQNRYNPPIVFVKSLLDAGKLGKVYSFHVNGFWNRPPSYYSDWRGKKETDGGTLYTQFSHFIDLIIWLCGQVQYVQFLSANQAHSHIEFEDAGLIQFKMQSGTIGSFNYSVNTFQKNMEGSITLICEKGTIKIGGQYLNELAYFSVAGIDKPTLSLGNSANQYDNYQGSMSNHDKIYTHLLQAINDEQYPFLEAREAIATIELIEKIYNQSV